MTSILTKMRERCSPDLVDPVRVENPEASELPSGPLFGNRSQVTLELELCDTLVLGLSVHNTLGDWPLPASTANTNAVHHITLMQRHDSKNSAAILWRTEKYYPRTRTNTALDTVVSHRGTNHCQLLGSELNNERT